MDLTARTAIATLALLWIAIAGAYQIGWFARLSPVAGAFAIVLLFEAGAMVLWSVHVRRKAVPS